MRTNIAHELSLKAPENPELAHHLGRQGIFGRACLKCRVSWVKHAVRTTREAEGCNRV